MIFECTFSLNLKYLIIFSFLTHLLKHISKRRGMKHKSYNESQIWKDIQNRIKVLYISPLEEQPVI